MGLKMVYKKRANEYTVAAPGRVNRCTWAVKFPMMSKETTTNPTNTESTRVYEADVGRLIGTSYSVSLGPFPVAKYPETDIICQE